MTICTIDLANVLILLNKDKECSASALVMGRVHAITRRQWIFRKESASQTPRESRRLSGIGMSDLHSCDSPFLLSHRACHLMSSFLRDFGKVNISPSVACLPTCQKVVYLN